MKILMLLTFVGCAVDDTAVVEQPNCTSPPIVARDHATCQPANTLAQRTQQYAYLQEQSLGVPTDLTIDPGCDTAACSIGVDYGYDHYSFNCEWACSAGTCVAWCTRQHCDVVNGELWNCAPY